MVRRCTFKKFIIAILIITLTFSNWAILGEFVISNAASELELQTGDTKNKNVKFDIGAPNGEGLAHQLVSSINELAVLKAYISVENEGYLKDISLTFSGENNETKNFDIIDILQEENTVKTASSSQIELNQIQENKTVSLEFSIRRNDVVKQNLNKLEQNNSIKLTATYVDREGKESKIEKTVLVNVLWKGENNILLESNISRYTDYELAEEKGVILTQEIILNQENTDGLPYKSIEIKTEPIKLEEKAADEVIVKQGNKDVNFEILESGNIKITDNNSETDGIVENSNIQREYNITYVYKNAEIIETEINTKANADVLIYSSDNQKTVETELRAELKEKIQENISITSKTNASITKGKMYANFNQQEPSYETEYESNIELNIAYNKAIEEVVLKDVCTYFANAEEKKYELQEENNAYVYYKTTRVNVEKFKEILGEDGKIQILDRNNSQIAVIDKNTTINENGEYIIEYGENAENLTFKTSEITSGGTLEIKSTKVIEPLLPYIKEQIKNFKTLQDEIQGTYKIEGVEESKQMESCFLMTELTETKTEANLSIDTNKLSSITKNQNIELKIELNNNKETSDLYENPSFEIELPKEITNIEIKESNVLFDDELKIDSIDKVTKNGKIVLKINLKGKQTKFLLEEYINGTTVVINADIDVDIRTTSKTEKVLMKYYNQNASTYNIENYGEYETSVEFISPVAMIIGTEISNYNSDGSEIMTVLQGEKTGKLEIFTEAKIAENNVLVMNNTGNECEDLTIIGRIPFKDNTSILEGQLLGTTIDTKLTELVKVESDKTNIEIYYTDNGKADRDLEKTENNWTKDATDLSNIKSFMVKINEKVMQSDIINIKYNFEIPANLEHNAYLYQDIVAYYNNNREVAKVEETAKSDSICLTTGRGPQMEIVQTASIPNGNEVNEGQKIRYTISIKNTGIDPIKNLVIRDILPENSIYTVYTRNGLSVGYDEKMPEAQLLMWNIETLEVGNTATVQFDVEVNKLPTVEEYYSNYDNVVEENGKYYLKENNELKEITNIPDIYMINQVFVNADDLAKEIQAENYQNLVKSPEILVTETSTVAEEVLIRENTDLTYSIRIKNNKQEDINNINISKVLPEGLEFKAIYTLVYNSEYEEWEKDIIGSYDENTRTINMNIGNLKPDEDVQIKIEVQTEKLEAEEYNRDIETITKITADNMSEYIGNTMKNTIAKSKLVTEYICNNENKYVKDGEIIKYSIKVTNVSNISANNVEISDVLPEELELIKAEYSVGNFSVSTNMDANRKISATGNLMPNESMILTIRAKAVSKTQNVNIENMATINSQELGSSETETVTHVVEAVQETNSISMIETERKYTISGIAWYDQNRNGTRDNGENRLDGIEVMAINADSGEIVNKTRTDSEGNYYINELNKANYLIIYKYDTNKYQLADYKKMGVSETTNSDVINANIEENGSKYVGAISDTIRIDNSDFGNIDIGLADRYIFDFKLESGIEKITLQTSKQTKEYKYEYTNLAKLDIAPNELSGATAFVEYKIKVTNEGNVAGYVNNIIDYLPAEMSFNSEINTNWYIGQDGNLYTSSLADTIIKPGETKEISLILVKEMTEENTGINVNKIEIYETHNEYGIEDEDSIENNKSDTEDDYSQTTALLTVQTGQEVVYTTAALIILVVILVAVYDIKKHNVVFIKKNNKLYK